MALLPKTFWAHEPLKPAPFLAGLRDVVLERSHTRLPKWHFRFAPDLVIEIQPKPGERRDKFLIFDCLALQGPDISKDAFQARKERLDLYSLKFGIDASWDICPRRVGWPRGLRGASDVVVAAFFQFRSRVITMLQDGRLDTIDPNMMFSPSCLICGKGLSDPASMARWIGPECYGASSVSVRRIDELRAAA